IITIKVQQMIKAVFFDMDGTIADSEKIVWKVTRAFMLKRGIILTSEEEKMMYGLIWKESIKRILESRGQQYDQKIKNTIKERYVRNLKKEVAAVPGVHILLAELKNNFKIGLATNSRLREVEIIFDRLGFYPYFDLKLARNHIKNVKPHPEIYLKGADAFGVKPSECVVFEDSIVGLTAAKSAGMKCITIVNTYSAEDLKMADMVINSYSEITAEKIRQMGLG
ncbi:MAG: HAD family phosphatase, partial [Actinobacteria bacterium]|nr:HAD family phosphatase [Actinomycetota bacterium]